MSLPSTAATISTPNNKRLQRTSNPTPPLSARTVHNHAETILVVLEICFFSKYYHCSSFPNRGDLQIDIKRRSRNLRFT